MTIEKLSTIFDTLTKNYQTLFDQANAQPFVVSYASLDFFSLEPYFNEMNHISSDLLTFYPSQEALPKGKEIHLCTMREGKLIFTRHLCDNKIYYDSFYLYEDNEEWRYHVYVNNDEVTPIKVEHLVKECGQQPKHYEVLSQYGYQCTHYMEDNGTIKGDKFYGDENDILLPQGKLEIHFSPDESEIEKITHTDNQNNQEIVYYNRYKNISLDTLIETAKSRLIKTLTDALANQNTITEEISCVLLEYTIQGPFPPTVGLGQTTEIERYLKDDEHPLAYYNNPDMEYFSEAGIPAIDFYAQDRALYDDINAQLLNNYQYKEYKVIVFDAYVDICKKLNRSRKFKTFFPVSDNFHVIARDFEECNEWGLMQAILSKKALKKISKAILTYDKKPKNSPEDEISIEFAMMKLETLNENLPQLIENMAAIKTQDYYSSELLFHLEPFKFEMTHNNKNPYTHFTDQENLSVEITGDPYYHYKLSGENVLYVARYSGEELSTETYFVYGKEIDFGCTMNEGYTFYVESDTRSLGHYESTTHRDNHTLRYDSIFEDGLIETLYRKNEASLTTSAEKDETRIIGDRIYNRSFLYQYRYDNAKTLIQISTCRNESVNSDSAKFNEDNASVVYCIDHRHIAEAMEKVVQSSYDFILTILKKKKLSSIAGFALEYDKTSPFPIFHAYTLTFGKSQAIKWSKFSVFDSNLNNDRRYINFNCYTHIKSSGETMSLSADEAHEYVYKAFNQIANKLSAALKHDFQVDIPVYIIPAHGDKSDINDLLKLTN